MIPYGRQNITQADLDEVVEVLQSDFLTQGPKVPEFEQAICQSTNALNAVAVNSATSALHIACLALDVGPKDIVWTSPITFVASANCALYCGANVDFVDVDSSTGNMCARALAIKLQQAKQCGRLPKVIIPVHLAGHSCDMAAISKLARQYHVKIIEDASHAIGSMYASYKVGSCQYSDITVFSFHPVKIITTAEGGVATTNDTLLAARMAMLRSHGVTRDKALLLRPDEGDWYYEQHQLGFNYRMTELQAALGVSQLTRLASFVAQRNELAATYHKKLAGLPLTIVEPLDDSLSARHLFIIKLHHPEVRREVFDVMRAAGIQVHVHYFPVHLQPYYLSLGFKEGDFPNAERFYRQILSLPLYYGLSSEQIIYIAETLKSRLTE